MALQATAYMQQAELTPAEFLQDVRKISLAPNPNLTVAQGTILGQVTSANVSDVQTIATTGGGTGGTITFGFGGPTGIQYFTVPYNATAAQFQAAMQALGNVGAGNVLCTGGALGSAGIVATFSGALAYGPQPLLFVSANNITGGSSPSVTVTHTTTGVKNGAVGIYAQGNSDGTQTPIGISNFSFITDPAGNVYLGNAAGGPYTGNPIGPNCSVVVGGYFNTSALVGLDNNAVLKLGRLVSGVLAAGVLKVN